jgi:amino acid adenylation domain-containing protein
VSELNKMREQPPDQDRASGGTAIDAARRRELAELLARRTGDASSRVPVARRPCDEIDAPLSCAQEGLWLAQQLNPGSCAYNVLGAWRADRETDPHALERAVRELLRRHAALRTAFPVVDGNPVQRVEAADAVDIGHIDLPPRNGFSGQQQIEAFLEKELETVFDLTLAPPIRIMLVRTAEGAHVLSLCMHHILVDGWSFPTLHAELERLYEAYVRGEAPRLDPPTVDCGDLAWWQRRWLGTDSFRRRLEECAARLRGAPVLEIPTDRPRSTTAAFSGASAFVEIDAAERGALARLGAREGATEFISTLAVFLVLLHRYSGQSDIVIGSPVTLRSQKGLEAIVGLLLNMGVLRVDLSGDPSFVTVLRRTREAVAWAFDNRDVPFERLVQAIQPIRDPARHPLFDVIFNMESEPTSDSRGAGFLTPVSAARRATVRYDLEMNYSASADALQLRFDYNTTLFDAQTLERMLGHFRRLLDAMLASPELPIGKLPILSDAEYKRIVYDWNATAREYRQPQRLHDLVAAQVSRTPDARAVVYEGTSLTFAELDRRAARLAQVLTGLGVGPDVLVGVCMERSLELVVGLYGILKAGGAYVPMDPEYPAERLAYMLADAEAPVLLTQSHLAALVPNSGAQVICVDVELQRPNAGEPVLESGGLAAGPDDLAYLIYTSGSTGRPKGVMVTHRAICNRLLWMQEAYDLGPEDRVLQKTPFSFDVSVWEFFWPLMTGAPLVMARPGGHRDTGYLVDAIREHGVTTLHFVPSMLRVFLEDARARECAPVKRVICSGEALGRELQDRFFDCMDAELHNLYGPTEAAVDVTYWRCARDDPGRSVPIGRPVANTQLYVLDPNMQPVPVGVAGELHIGGVQVARGYLNRAALTAERFVADPFRGGTARLYKTGDLVRYRQDGAIEYLGRMDNQVKLRGMRVELGEIESVLGQHPGVRQTVLSCREDRPGDTRLVAYVVAAPEAADAQALETWLGTRLPNYMVPTAWVFLDTVPLTSNGKLDFKSLPAPDRARQPRSAFVAPRTEVERRLAEIWAQMLGVESVGVHERFFDLGGYSLLAMQVVSRVRDSFGVSLELVEMFEAPTVAEMALRIERTLWAREARVRSESGERRTGVL